MLFFLSLVLEQFSLLTCKYLKLNQSSKLFKSQSALGYVHSGLPNEKDSNCSVNYRGHSDSYLLAEHACCINFIIVGGGFVVVVVI